MLAPDKIMGLCNAVGCNIREHIIHVQSVHHYPDNCSRNQRIQRADYCKTEDTTGFSHNRILFLYINYQVQLIQLRLVQF